MANIISNLTVSQAVFSRVFLQISKNVGLFCIICLSISATGTNMAIKFGVYLQMYRNLERRFMLVFFILLPFP